MNKLPNTKFINYSYSSFISNWQNYYYQNFTTFFEELKELKNNLDTASKYNIDNFVETILFKLATPSRNYLIRKNYLFSSIEQQKIKKEHITKNEIKNIKTSFNIKDSFILQTAVFKFHNGLKMLPIKITNLLANKTIIDCGGYYGDSSLVFTKYKPKNIYTFEPNSVNFKYLEQTIKANNLLNTIHAINKGVSDRNKVDYLAFNSINSPNLGAKIINNNETNKSLKRKIKKEKVELITIDNFVDTNNIKNIGLIKIDTEGLELEALIGAKNTIKYKCPIILVAVYHNANEFLKAKPFIESINSNYNFLMCPLDTLDVLKEFYLIAYPNI